LAMRPTCLIAETDPFIAALLDRFAEVSDLTPQHVGIGQDVADTARRLRPAVIILDVELPGKLRGWEAASQLRSDPELRNIPIIACSWLACSEAQSIAGPAAGYLQKPDLHYEDFLAALRQAGLPGRADSHAEPLEPDR
jgi:CheY-like chemotaxis protein